MWRETEVRVCVERDRGEGVWRETEVRVCVEGDTGETTERSFIHDQPFYRNISNPYKIAMAYTYIHTYKQSQSHLFTQGREGSSWCETKTFMTEEPFSLQ